MRFASGRKSSCGVTTMPATMWPLTTLASTRLARPPAMAMPTPKPFVASGVPSPLLSTTALAANTAWRCGYACSLRDDSDSMPTRLARQVEVTTYRSPPAFAPWNPTALCSPSESRTTVLHGKHWPTYTAADGWPDP